MSNPTNISRRKTLKRLSGSGLALTFLSTSVVADGSTGDEPDGPTTNDNTMPPGGGGSAADTAANAAKGSLNVSGCKSYESRVSLGVHYYGSVASEATDEWFHEFCVSGSSYARMEPLTCGEMEKNQTINYQKVRVENNNAGDTFLTSENPDPVYRGVTPTPPGSASSVPGYSDTVRTVLETAISYQYPTAAYALTAEELATSVYNDLKRIEASNQTESNAIERTWDYTGTSASNPYYPPADANNYFRFLVSSQNSYFIDVTAKQEIDGPPMDISSPLSTSLRFSTDTGANSLSTTSEPVLTEEMTKQEVISTFPSKRFDSSELPEGSPIREQVGRENLTRVILPITFEDPEAGKSTPAMRQKS